MQLVVFDKRENLWNNLEMRLRILPRKDLLSTLNSQLQCDYAITITTANITNGLPKSLVRLAC